MGSSVRVEGLGELAERCGEQVLGGVAVEFRYKDKIE